MFQALERVLQDAAADGGGSNHERAVGDGFCNGVVLFGLRKQRGSSDGRTRFAKGRVVGVHQAQAKEAKVAHGARRSANVERIARGHEDDAQAVEFYWSTQGWPF